MGWTVMPAISCPSRCGVLVEEGDDPEAARGEAAVGRERVAEVAHPDDGDGPVLGEAELAGDLVGEVVDLVADTTHAVGPEVGQVLAELGAADPGSGGQLLGGHRRDPALREAGQGTEVLG